MMITLAMDVVVAGLLLATIFYCWKVSRYMQEIRDGRSQLAQLLEQFDKSTTQAQASIAELKKTGDKVADRIQVKIEKAEFMTDDLAFMTDKANKLAEQLSQYIAAGKSLPAARKDAEPQRAPHAAAAPITPPKKSASAAESAAAILDSLLAKPRPNEVAAANSVAARGATALEQIARAIPRESAATAVATAPVAAQAGPRPRSQAEQELLEVLKAIR